MSAETGDAEPPSKSSDEDSRAGPPEWLNLAFINDAFASAGEDVVVESIEIKYAVPPGNNFCSSIFRVATHIRGRKDPRSLIVKCLPEGEIFSKLVRDGQYFEKETLVLTKIAPFICEQLQKFEPSKPFARLSAQCLCYATLPQTFIVLEDLTDNGFYIGNRLQGLDIHRATLVWETLGRFHGSTHHILREQPDLFHIMTSPFEGDGMGTRKEFDDTLDTVAGVIGEWSEYYKEKVLKLKERLYHSTLDVNRQRPGKFNVLAHGDLWVNNIMFKDNDAGMPTDIRLLDFQLSHVTNPAIDLILFLYTSLEEDVFTHYRDDLLKIYTNSLSTTLEFFGENPITFEEINEYLDEARDYIFLASFMWLPVIRMDKGKKFDMEEFLNDGASSQVETYRTPEFAYWMKKLLPEFESRGMFDSL